MCQLCEPRFHADDASLTEALTVPAPDGQEVVQLVGRDGVAAEAHIQVVGQPLTLCDAPVSLFDRVIPWSTRVCAVCAEAAEVTGQVY